MSDSEKDLSPSDTELGTGGEEEDLEVEEILDCKKDATGQVLYLLKWKGFTEEHNSWEPEANLGCPELLEAFKAKRAKKEAPTRGPGPKKVVRRSKDSNTRRDSKEDDHKHPAQPTDAGDTSNMTPPAKRKKSNKMEKPEPMDEEENKLISKVTSDVKAKSAAKQNTKVVSKGVDDSGPKGFDRGLEAEKILGATDCLGDLVFLMKWKGSNHADLVNAKQANIECPQVVIKFYEERLTWHSTQELKDIMSQGVNLKL
ncbi:chromobox protein homolog 5-like [Thrips palmi]|uniref:Chromobox protein homolog 5-like n=1 Tax=Thrips palmi TaxID=161013 RepID=A0A6P9AI10_THRPL|nr:chromobox protein homolog 5-like [Thrips palmi]